MEISTTQKARRLLLIGLLGAILPLIGDLLIGYVKFPDGAGMLEGYFAAALLVSEALFRHLSWLVILSEALMLPPYIYWLWMMARGSSVFPKGMALSNPLIFYVLLKLLTMLMPDSAFRLAFTNGLMSESMLIWFGSMLLWNLIYKNNCLEGKIENEKQRVSITLSTRQISHLPVAALKIEY